MNRFNRRSSARASASLFAARRLFRLTNTRHAHTHTRAPNPNHLIEASSGRNKELTCKLSCRPSSLARQTVVIAIRIASATLQRSSARCQLCLAVDGIISYRFRLSSRTHAVRFQHKGRLASDLVNESLTFAAGLMHSTAERSSRSTKHTRKAENSCYIWSARAIFASDTAARSVQLILQTNVFSNSRQTDVAAVSAVACAARETACVASAVAAAAADAVAAVVVFVGSGEKKKRRADRWANADENEMKRIVAAEGRAASSAFSLLFSFAWLASCSRKLIDRVSGYCCAASVELRLCADRNL